MVDRRLLARRAPEHARLPRVEVRVKVDDGDRAVRAVDRAEERQHDRVVPSERDHARVVLSVLGEGHERCARQRVVRQRRERRAVQQRLVSVLDLLDRVRVVVRRHGYVPAIDDLQPGQERVDLQRHVVPAVQRQAARSCADSRRSEACAGSVRRARVLPVTSGNPFSMCGDEGDLWAYEWSAEERDIKRDVSILREALDPREFGKSGDAREDGISGDW